MLHRIPLNHIKTLLIEYLIVECKQEEDAKLIEEINSFEELAKHINKYWDLEAFFYAIGIEY